MKTLKWITTILFVAVHLVFVGCGSQRTKEAASQSAANGRETQPATKNHAEKRETQGKSKQKSAAGRQKKQIGGAIEKQPPQVSDGKAKRSKKTRTRPEPLDESRWVLVPRQAQNNSTAAQRVELKLETRGLRAEVRKPQLDSFHLRLLEKIRGDFVFRMTAHLPRRNEMAKGGMGITYVGFRDEDGKVVTVSGVRLSQKRQTLAILVSRSGEDLQFTVGGRARQIISNARTNKPGHFFLFLGAPARVWISDYRLQQEGSETISRSIVATDRDLLAKTVDPKPKVKSSKGRPRRARRVEPVALTFGDWELMGSLNDRQNLLIREDVRLRRDSDGIRVSKTYASRIVRLRYRFRVDEDFNATLRILLPKATELTGRRRGTVTVEVRPTRGATGTGVTVALPRFLRNERRDCTVRLQRLGHSITAERDGRNVGQAGNCSGAVDIFVVVRNDIHFWITDAQYEPLASLGTKRRWGKPVETVRLPAPLDDIRQVGGGRYLVLLFRSLRKLGLFDVRARKLLRIVSIEHPDGALIAAGEDKVVVVSPRRHEVTRFSIPQMKAEVTSRLPPGGKVTALALGSASQGPLLIASELDGRTHIQFVDLVKFRPFVDDVPRTTLRKGRFLIRASSDSRVFGFSTNSAMTMVLSGTRVTTKSEPQLRVALPGPTGRSVFTERGIFSNQLQKSQQQNLWHGSPAVPATREKFYLSVYSPSSYSSGDTTLGRVSLHLAPLVQPLATFDDIKLPGSSSRHFSARSPLSLDQRVMFDVTSGTIVAVAEAKNRLLVKSLDVARLLRETKLQHYLIVTSQPPAEVKPGSQFRYQLTTLASHPPLQYTLDAVPQGMKVSKSGLVTWDVPADFKGSNEIILSITDAKSKSRYHTFPVSVPFSRPAGSVKVVQQPTKKTLVKESVDVALPAPFDAVRYGRSGTVLAARLAGVRKIAVVNLVQRKIVRFIDLPNAAAHFTATQDHLVVVDEKARMIRKFHLGTGQLESKVPLPTKKPIHAIATGAASHGPILVLAGDSRLEVGLLDLVSLNLRSVPLLERSALIFDKDIQVRASGDGRTFAMWRVNSRPAGLAVLRVNATTAKMAYRHETPGYASLNVTGSELWAATGRYSSDLKLIGPKVNSFLNFHVFGTHDQFYVRVPRINRDTNRSRASVTVSVHLDGEKSNPLLIVPNTGIRPAEYHKMTARAGLSLDRRLRVVPLSGLLVTLPESNRVVRILKFDLTTALKNVSRPYLLIHSLPPREVIIGRTYQYQLRVAAQANQVDYRVAAGPSGMTVSKSGLVSWVVSPKEKRRFHTVILSISTSNPTQERFQTFELEVRGIKPPTVTRHKLRTWTDKSGTYQLQGRFVRRDKKEVYLLRVDNTEVSIPFAKLSKADQRYVNFVAPKKNPNSAVPRPNSDRKGD